jgi:hypothetical protein
MSTANADYSNTIFYKIYCKDPSIKDLYIGHTTNFVQRKHSHKQSCINPNSVNYNCKLYRFIRDNMGWDNWTMDIIAFHKCEDLQSAKVQEQHYFKEYNATLNSVEPSPKRKQKKQISVKPPKNEFYCNSCRVYFNTRKLQEEHNKRPRHLKMIQTPTQTETETETETEITNTIKMNNQCKYKCNVCDYVTSRKSQYERHINTRKHIMTSNGLHLGTNNYTCECGKEYSCRQNLYRHKQHCDVMKEDKITSIPIESQQFDTSLIVELLKQNKELHKMVIELAKNKNI